MQSRTCLHRTLKVFIHSGMQLFSIRQCLALGFLIILPCAALAQTDANRNQNTLSVAEIFNRHGGPIGEPPQNYVWSPDGRAVTYRSADSVNGKRGDVISMDAASGAVTTLVSGDTIHALYEGGNDARDLDHRARYKLSSYQWAHDGKQLLFDATGQIWLHDLATGTGKHLADTGVGSGDDLKISPDGRRLSFVRGHNLYVQGLDGSGETAVTTTQKPTLLNGEVDWVYEEELDVTSNYFWSPDSARIAYLQMDEAAVPAYPLIDWSARHSGVDEQRYPQPGDANPKVRVGVVSAQGGATTWLALPISAGNDYVPRLGWVDKQTLWVEVLRRDQRQRDLYFADATTGKTRLVLAETADRFLDEAYDVKFLSNGKFLWTSWRDGHTHIYLYDHDKRHPMQSDATMERQLTHGDWEALSVAGVDEKRGAVYYTSNETDPREEMLWRIGLDGSGKKLLSAEHGVHKVTLNTAATGYVDSFSSAMVPPVVNVCEVDGGCRAFWHGGSTDALHLVKPTAIVSKAADGTTLYGTVLLPPTMKGRASVPLIMNPYGGPHAQVVRNEWAKGTLFDQLLMQRGFAVLHVDNRGTGNRGRKFADEAYRDFGAVQFTDQMAVLDEVLKHYPQLDAKRLGWWGWSWGGTFTLYAMTHSDRFAAGVAVAPVTDWRLYDSIYTERYLGTPEQNAQGYRDDSVVNRAGKMHGHLLIAQGTEDDNVHMQNSVEYIQGLVEAGKQYDLLLYPGLTHSLDTPAARTQLYERILQQFETYLGNRQ